MTMLPVPSSDHALQSAPDFIVVDDANPWVDPDWVAASRIPASERNEMQQMLWSGGPRPQPWGAAAFIGTLPDGRRAYFPSAEAYRTFSQTHQNSQRVGQTVLGQMAAGLAGAGGPAPLPPEQAAKQPGDAQAGPLGP